MTSIVVGKDRISVLEAERYVAGTANVYKMKVAFSEDWEGLEKHLMFRTYNESTGCPNDLIIDIIGCSEQFPMPSEIFASTTNRLQVGCYGKCGDDIVLNTRWTTLGKVVSGTLRPGCGCGCQVPSKPSPMTYEVLKNLIDQKADQLTYEDGRFILWGNDKIISDFYVPVALPSGGSQGQILAKASDEDGDYEWISVDSLSVPGSGSSLNVPIGTIQIWSGSIDSIPESFSLCDGQNGTPDLRKAMIVGASESLEPGTVVEGSIEDEPMPIRAKSDSIRYYVLAFIQKTSLTEADKKHGQTAFDIAVENGFEGTEEEWLETLKGDSAYDVAVKNGFEGTEEEWLKTLGSSVLEDISDKTITSIKDLPGLGAIMVENVWFNPTDPNSNNLYLNSDVMYIHQPDPSKLVITTLENKVYECEIAEDGTITSIKEIVPSTSGDGQPGKDGKSAYDIAVENGFEGTVTEWLESLKGSQGEPGPNGQNGASAYEIAVKNGFEGDETEWLASLKGEKGEPGKDGAIIGGDGQVVVGPKGDSAYEVAVTNGFSGTEEEWLASLKGSTGLSAYQVAKANGFEGTEAEWVESLKGADGSNGADGKSAYNIAVENGFVGSETEWLTSLKGEKGQDGTNGADGSNGKSAYEIAVENGYNGTESEWVDSLTGKSAYDIAVENGFTGSEQDWIDKIQNGSAEDSIYDDSITNLGAGTVQEAIEKLANLTKQPDDSIAKVEDTAITSRDDLVEAGFGNFSGTIQIENTSFAGSTLPNGYIYLVTTEDGVTVYTLDGLRTVYTYAEDGRLTVSSITDAYANGSGGTGSEGQPGRPGADGKDGKSAYEIAVENGFVGSETEWLESLKGRDGIDGVNGTDGEPGRDGTNGKSAYELAVEAGFEGDEAAWLASLAGQDGTDGTDGIDGLSAYELAVKAGFEGTQDEWLESLKGKDGTNGTDGAPGQDGTNGKSAYQIAVDNGFTGSETEWLESLKGTQGDPGQNGSDGVPGQDGSDGKSAYQIAIDNGFQGSEEDWLASLVGAPGEDGVDGTNGKNGLSAYELAVQNGFDGGLDQWLETLKGPQGDSAYDIAVSDGFNGTKTEWLASLKGEKGADGQNGSTAYEIAVQNGFEGSEEDWLASLKGATGAKGKSAYQLAVDAGFEGDETAWLASLKGGKGDKGDKGDSNYEIAVENGYEGTAEEWLQTTTGPQGPEGKSAYQVAVENGYEGTEQQWLDSLKGIGIAEFLTYSDLTITSREMLTAIPDQTVQSVHFVRCRFATASGKHYEIKDELVTVSVQESMVLLAGTGWYIAVSYGEDSIFTTLDEMNITDNNFTNELKEKLESLENYTLPIANTVELGGIKVTQSLTAAPTETALKVSSDGTAFVDWDQAPRASTNTAGLVKLGKIFIVDENGDVSIDSSNLEAGSVQWDNISNKPTNFVTRDELTNVYRYKHSVDTFDDLPTENLEPGFVYNVISTGMNYAWTGEGWDSLGQIFQITPITNEQIDALFA